MNKIALPLAVILGLIIVVLLPIIARAGETIGAINVNVQPLPSKDHASGSSYGVCHGYIELRVRLKNAASGERIVKLAYPQTDNPYLNNDLTSTRTVRLAGKQEAVVSLFWPVGDGDGGSDTLEVRVDGVQDPLIMTVPNLCDPRYGSANYPAAVLISRGVPQEFRDRVHAAAASDAATSGSSAEATLALLRSELPASQWSTNWLGYSCFDAIVITGKEAEEMPPQVQSALRRYLECGGVLLLHGRDLPAAFSQGGVSEDQGYCFIGFGYAAASRDEGKAGWDAIYEKLTKSPPHVYHPQKKSGNGDNLLVAEATIPVRGLFVLVLLFGVSIGPANLWLLSRYKRRIWLWWNVPVISLSTCFVVFAYSLAAEGITGEGKTASMTMLDERCHRAATIGYVSYYCPLAPSTGPQFGVNTDVALLANNLAPRHRHPYHRSSSGLRLVDWTAGQHLISGWVTARVPAYYQIRKNEDRRERLIVEKRSGDSVQIVNALGADIKRLYWADAAGRIFAGNNIPAGAERTLAALSTTLKKGVRHLPLQKAFNSVDWLAVFRSWTRGRPIDTMLSPGCYVAFLDKSPFVESPLAGVESEHSVAIVYGISKGEGDGR